MKQSTFNTIVGILFGLMTVLHGLRLFSSWEIVINGRTIPLWGSWVGLAIAGFLTIAAFRPKR
ncbi:MAG: hypothetical protein COV76_05580 [Candidatus Omnitrophica bacterium CG11_big_fil_rev_8_21_14_0_20_64_10]|nr:MAG: hypothetical protein COV76_05580 [Candidatus Omnitrophica bacterium CG11_big_fil_rev_8_21_14_0_20_64_10]